MPFYLTLLNLRNWPLVTTVYTGCQAYYVFFNCTERKNRVDLDVHCKGLLFLIFYSQACSILWMSVEGFYLVSRFTIFAMRNTEGPLHVYVLFGWVLPFVVTVVWAALHEFFSDTKYCWMPFVGSHFMWIWTALLGLALVLNFVFLVVILFIIIRKLGAENTMESKRIWRMVKATLLLVPLLGVSNIPLFYEPKDASAEYHLISSILQYSQGIFIAILYCFCNAEIQQAFSRQLHQSNVYQSFWMGGALGTDPTGSTRRRNAIAAGAAGHLRPHEPQRRDAPVRQAAAGTCQGDRWTSRTEPVNGWSSRTASKCNDADRDTKPTARTADGLSASLHLRAVKTSDDNLHTPDATLSASDPLLDYAPPVKLQTDESVPIELETDGKMAQLALCQYKSNFEEIGRIAEAGDKDRHDLGIVLYVSDRI